MVKKLSIFLILLFLVISAFLIRLDVFIKSRNASIDEIVYYRMGVQVSRDWADYNTIPYAHYLKSGGRELPKYFFQPLYKHPPLFTFLVALSMRMFGTTPVAAEYVSLLFAVLMIPLTYLLGTLVFNRIIGLIAAFFVYIDPVSIITSQKIWPDTMLAFFMVLTIYLFVCARKYEKDIFYIFIGITAGLAILTKYPGVIPLGVIWFFALFYDQDIFRIKKFMYGMIVIVLIVYPWILWNYVVYGHIFSFIKHARLHGLAINSVSALALLLSLLIMLFLTINPHFRRQVKNYICDVASQFSPTTKGILIGLFMIGISKYLLKGLNLFSIPRHAWTSSIFANETYIFYIGRLLEYSLLYAFSYIALVRPSKAENKLPTILKLNSWVIILFFIIIPSFQTRYILAALPLLIILGVNQWYELLRASFGLPNKNLRFLAYALLGLAGIFIIYKTFYINVQMSFTNDMCYY